LSPSSTLDTFPDEVQVNTNKINSFKEELIQNSFQDSTRRIQRKFSFDLI